jgi:hypothetical protein
MLRQPRKLQSAFFEARRKSVGAPQDEVLRSRCAFFFAPEFLLSDAAQQTSSPPGLTRWSMLICGFEKPIWKSDQAFRPHGLPE